MSSHPNSDGTRTLSTRVHASLLLFCLLLGPLQAVAAPWLHKTLACCVTAMCPMHAHTPKAGPSGAMCDRTRKNAVDCTMKCAQSHEDFASLMPVLPKIVVRVALPAPAPVAARFSTPSAGKFSPVVSVSPPDQPPRL